MIKRNLLLLFLGQGLTGTVMSLTTLSATMVALQIAPLQQLVTLPVTAMIVGTALMVYNVAGLMNRYGRRLSLMFGSLIGTLGAATISAAIYWHNFILLVAGTFITGIFMAFNQYYRFAAADLFQQATEKNRAVSLVISGGIIGGFLGPFLVTQTNQTINNHPYLGVFIASLLLCLLVTLLHSGLKFTESNSQNQPFSDQRPLASLLTSKPFIIATVSSSAGFAIMVLVMNSMPLAMHHYQFPLADNASVMQWHFVGMYAPALILSTLVKFISPFRVIIIGCLLNLLGCYFAINNVLFFNFWLSLFLVGCGWAFMYSGGTFMLNHFSHSKYKNQLEGINSFIIYLFNVVAAFSAGALMTKTNGWLTINSSSLLIIALVLLMVLLLKPKQPA